MERPGKLPAPVNGCCCILVVCPCNCFVISYQPKNFQKEEEESSLEPFEIDKSLNIIHSISVHGLEVATKFTNGGVVE